MSNQPIPISNPDAKGYKLSHKLEQQSDGSNHWRIRLDVAPPLLAQVEAVTYSAEDKAQPSQSGLESDQFSALMGSCEPMTIHAVIKLKGGEESKQITYSITPERAKGPDKFALIEQARNVLSPDYVSNESQQDFCKHLLALCKQMEAIDQFDYAAELLLKKHRLEGEEGKKPPLEECQRLAKCIYKDSSLSSYLRFDLAIDKLDKADPMLQSDNCETLGLAGAIYKRWWQYDHQHSHLALSRFYYRRGFETWKKYLGGHNDLYAKSNQNDDGWNAINYAYILELEAVNNMEELGAAAGVQQPDLDAISEAQETRKYILTQFVNDPFGKPQLNNPACALWVLATIAEAYFGLGEYAHAETFISLYKYRQMAQPWELRTFSQQILSIAYLQQTRQRILKDSHHAAALSEAAAAVADDGIKACLKILDINCDAQETNNYGKVGLAFSGGGFRASLYHIGVLAALAERDELKNIEVISCVSGGSIIGAYYYLKLKFLLEEKSDDAITAQDYIDLVREIEVDFLKGIQKNLRMRVFSNLVSNFKMLTKNYSRTNRLGELYEKHLYKPLVDKHVAKLLSQGKAGNPGSNYQKRLEEYQAISRGDRHMYMSDLFIVPEEGFVLGTDNWKREHKVPQLVLNATSVNTGHNWQFTASWMGEPAFDILSDIDVKPRLRRMYYKDAPAAYQNFRLGYAVGASSCVPVLFEPLPLNDLYPDMELQLIDGGLHDNQGIAALIDQECKNIIISDASGQLPTNSTGVSGPLSLFVRADSILQERLRELQFLDMKERKNTALISRLHHVHLKQGLVTQSVSWIDCKDPARQILANYAATNSVATSYHIVKDAQERIAEIRTDLDAFHDTEAYALMYDGYRQVHQALTGSDNSDPTARSAWNFLGMKKFLTDEEKEKEVDKLLQISSRVPFKVYEMLGGKRITYSAGSVLGIGLIAGVYNYWGEIPAEVAFSKWTITFAVIVFVAGLLFKPAAIILNPKGFIRKQLLRVGVAISGWIIFNLYLGLFNGIYLKKGKLKK